MKLAYAVVIRTLKKTDIWQGRWAICENTVPMTCNNPNDASVINSQHWECKQNCVLGENYEEVLHMQPCTYSEGASWNKWDVGSHYGILPHKKSPTLFLQYYPSLPSPFLPYSNISLTKNNSNKKILCSASRYFSDQMSPSETSLVSCIKRQRANMVSIFLCLYKDIDRDRSMCMYVHNSCTNSLTQIFVWWLFLKPSI